MTDTSFHRLIRGARFFALTFLATGTIALSHAQVNVVTAHNDIGRTGQNLQETVLTPANVNATQFGKLFSQPVNGIVLAQPLYVSGVTIAGTVHNVVYVAPTSGAVNFQGLASTTENVYAFDADTNGGANAKPLWQASLLTPAGKYTPNYGVIGTPVIDVPNSTLYLVSSEFNGSTPVYRLHALNITTGAEKLGGPVIIQGSVTGTGSGSSGGVEAFNPAVELQRPALLLLNGVVYVGFGAISDQGSWHGWLFSYNANSLQMIDVFNPTPNGTGGGFWMGGAGFAAEVNNPAKPYGRMFVPTGNGSYQIGAPTVAGKPFSNPSNQYGMTELNLDLSSGMMTVEDTFTPYNEADLDGQDGDLGAGGSVLLPTQALASGKVLKSLVQVGKSGMIYILDRDSNTDGSNNPATEYSPAGLGGFSTTADNVVQEVLSPVGGALGYGAGIWGAPGYWNNNIYIGGNNPASGNRLIAYSFVNGVLSKTITSQSATKYAYPGPTPSISANGNKDGIVWVLVANGGLASLVPETLTAYDATNLGNTLYSSNTNLSRDSPGLPAEYVVPTIANGKVYAAVNGQLSVYGLFASNPTAPAPVISPGSKSFTGSQSVTLSDAIGGATIYYTTDGSTPNSGSAVYTNPFVVTTNETVTAIASAANYEQSVPASATFTSTTTPINPVFSKVSGTYSGPQTLTLTSSDGATIYYTIDGPAPTTASTVYTNPITISASEIVQAVAIAPGPFSSSVVSATYTIQPAGSIDFTGGFAQAQGPMTFNGSTDLDDFRLQLTNGGTSEAGSAFYATPVNIQQFTTNFTFQLSNPIADGITFTIQNNSATALGGTGSNLGYGGIPNSLAIKFDLFNNAGEGPDSTGLYLDGTRPTVPSINLSSTGINLHSGDFFNASLTYDGTTLTMTLTDALTLATWSHVWVINIPAVVGSNTAYVGFTGGAGGHSASQKLTSWTYVPGPPLPSYSSGFSAGTLSLNGGATLNGTAVELTDGGYSEARSAFFTIPVNVQQFIGSFDFQLTNVKGEGFTFTIQGAGSTAVGLNGDNLGFGGIPKSVAIKYDLFDNAGEGSNSTGLYLDGAIPTVPATDLTPFGIGLHSGDIFNVQLAYNGSTLTVTTTDTVTNAVAVQSYNVDIPAIVGGSTAYVGFTGGTSAGEAAVQKVFNFSFGGPPVTGPGLTSGFASSQTPLTLNGGAAFNGSALQITDGNGDEKRSAFFTTPVSVQEFLINFNFQFANANADGFTFTIQGNGPKTVGAGGEGLGYYDIPNSLAVKFDLHDNSGEGPDSTGLYIDGAMPTIPSVDLTAAGINFHGPDTFNAQLAYNGTTLTVVITDTVTGATATQTYKVNIPSIVGGNTAYVGFTGSTGVAGAQQEILTWSYSQEPAFTGGFAGAQSLITLNGGAELEGKVLELTDPSSHEARSAFYSLPVNVEQFATNFNFQLLSANADGFTFTIQGGTPTSLPTAVGAQGAGLGYQGIPNSVAVKFDLYSNAGEGSDSTGMYTNGALPTLPDIDLTSTAINLHSGDIFNAAFTYDGTTLTEVITDTVTKATVTETYTVDIPSIVGGPTAYVGFTGGTGGLSSLQQILNWTYSALAN